MKFYLKIYRVYLKNYFQKSLEYRMDFIIGVLSMVVEQLLSIAFITIVFNNIPNIAGWSFGEMLLIYAFATLGRSIHVTFFDSLWTFGWGFVENGKFDSLLIKPLNLFLQLIFERIQYAGFFQFLIGLIALIYAFILLSIPLTFLNLIMIIVFVISSSAIYVGINLFFMTFSFWMVDSLPLMVTMFQFDHASRYPVSIFPTAIMGFLTFVLPYAFTGYYPAVFFLKDHFSYVSLLAPVIAFVICFIAYRFWLFGVKFYSGAGN